MTKDFVMIPNNFLDSASELSEFFRKVSTSISRDAASNRFGGYANAAGVIIKCLTPTLSLEKVVSNDPVYYLIFEIPADGNSCVADKYLISIDCFYSPNGNNERFVNL